jgi:DNA-binding response OmpR family regulator
MKILLIEDVDCLRRSITDYLEDEDYVVVSAPDGELGLALALTGQFDAMILDLMLPGIDGYEVLSKVRAAGIECPVVILTARGAPPDKARGYELGADHYLTKPFEMEDLMAALGMVLKGAKSDRPGGV